MYIPPWPIFFFFCWVFWQSASIKVALPPSAGLSLAPSIPPLPWHMWKGARQKCSWTQLHIRTLIKVIPGIYRELCMKETLQRCIQGCFEYLLQTWSLLCFKMFTVFCPPPCRYYTVCARTCGYDWLQWYAALTPSNFIVSMRNVGVRYTISHHLASLISVSTINPVRVILLMLLFSSFSSPPAYCTLFKFLRLQQKRIFKTKKKKSPRR